jgi:hypothetical protein
MEWYCDKIKYCLLAKTLNLGWGCLSLDYKLPFARLCGAQSI